MNCNEKETSWKSNNAQYKSLNYDIWILCHYYNLRINKLKKGDYIIAMYFKSRETEISQ